MRSPDLGDPVSLLERRVLYFGTQVQKKPLVAGDRVQICVQEVRGPHQTRAPRIDGRNPAASESCESHKAAMMNVCGPGSQLREAKGVWPYPLLISDPTQMLRVATASDPNRRR